MARHSLLPGAPGCQDLVVQVAAEEDERVRLRHHLESDARTGVPRQAITFMTPARTTDNVRMAKEIAQAMKSVPRRERHGERAAERF